jgi:hypothetical protein
MSEEENIKLVKIVGEYSILCDWKLILVLQEMKNLNLSGVFLYKWI